MIRCDDCGCPIACACGLFGAGARLVAENDRLRAELAEAYRWVRNHPSTMGDLACAQCFPDGEILIDGFVCVPHLAKRDEHDKERG